MEHAGLLAIECMHLMFVGAALAPSMDDWMKFAEAATPIVHELVAAGSQQCETAKKLLGLTYDQVQGRNAPDTDNSLHIDVITARETTRLNMSSISRHLQRTGYDLERPLVVLIHGFMESSTGESVNEMSQAFLENGGYNIMALDGGALINSMYFRSTTYVRFIGEKLGKVLQDLVDENIVTPQNINLVGHSLGAHIAGFAGKQFQHLSDSKIARITALDPAGPCFSSVRDDEKVQRGDAEFVDVIHTDGGLLGLKESVGDRDYFPNGGSVQPGCVFLPCCHSRAWQYYAESVRRPRAFPAKRCSDWDAYKAERCDGETSYMGLDAEAGRPGSYFLTTSGSPPYVDDAIVVTS